MKRLLLVLSISLACNTTNVTNHNYEIERKITRIYEDESPIETKIDTVKQLNSTITSKYYSIILQNILENLECIYELILPPI